MKLVFDPAKDAANRTKHGISLRRAADMDIALAMVDDRVDYGETRYRAFGFIEDEAYCLVFTTRTGVVRAISLRRAGKREMQKYAQEKKDRERR